MMKTIDQKIKEWLLTQGYPLEMEVAVAFENGGFGVSQSEFYLDPRTGVSREIDVRASSTLYTENTSASLSYVVECKKSTDKPWVLFTRENKIIDWEYANWYSSNENAWDYLIHAAIDGKIDLFPLNLHTSPRIAYGLTVAFTSGEDASYKAIQSVTRCALARIAKADEGFTIGEHIEVVLPVIVIDGVLVEAFLDKDNEVQVKEINEGIILWDGLIPERPRMAVHVVTRNGLEAFVERASATKDILMEDWENNLEDILEEMAQNRRELFPPEDEEGLTAQ